MHVNAKNIENCFKWRWSGVTNSKYFENAIGHSDERMYLIGSSTHVFFSSRFFLRGFFSFQKCPFAGLNVPQSIARCSLRVPKGIVALSLLVTVFRLHGRKWSGMRVVRGLRAPAHRRRDPKLFFFRWRTNREEYTISFCLIRTVCCLSYI